MKQIKCTSVGNFVHRFAFLRSSSVNDIVSVVLHRKLKLLQNTEVNYSLVLYL